MKLPALLLALVCWFAAAGSARAQVRRALLVGIDHYAEPANRPADQLSDRTRQRLTALQGTPARRIIDDLDGAFNDAKAMRELLIQKFGFEDRNIILLPNENQPATADNILGLLESHLIESAQPGDASFFFYAGHGSRIRNTSQKNENLSGLDSTIIPADAPLGVPDIRSKELARLFARAPQKNVALTVIMDSCFSGGASRGAMTRNKVRAQPPDEDVSVDEAWEGPLPEDQGVLVISASQDYEPAAEFRTSDLSESHGAFTWALTHVLGVSPVDESVDRIFQRTRALLQSKVPFQEPVLLAKKGRNQRGLFGQPAVTDHAATVAASRVAGLAVRINGGLAMSLREGCELKRVQPATPAARIKVTRVLGLSASDAIVSTPEDAIVHPGDLFELDKWVAPDREQLRVFIGDPAPQRELDLALQVSSALRDRAGITWIEDPTQQAPTHILSWDARKSKWNVRQNVAGAKPVWIEKLSRDAVARSLPASGVKPRLFVSLPPSTELAGRLRFSGDIAIAPAADLADYMLLGHPCSTSGAGCVEYAWALTDSAPDAAKQGPARPVRSDWFPARGASDAAAQPLDTAAHSLARIAGWLDLQSPSFDDAWPYHLVFQNATTKMAPSSAGVEGGECYKLMLQRSAADSGQSVPTRRVYVFVVDSFGKATLLFGDNLENEYPRVDGGEGAAAVLPLTNKACDVQIEEPYGADHYFLLATGTPIDNPETAFNFAGVRTRGGDNPLARLLENTARGTRGVVGNIPVNWSIQHLTLVSRPPGAGK